MLRRIPRFAKVAVLTAGLLLLAPAVALLQPPQQGSRSVLDDALVGVTYACPNQVCAFQFPSGTPFCKTTGDPHQCVIEGSCVEFPCD